MQNNEFIYYTISTSKQIEFFIMEKYFGILKWIVNCSNCWIVKAFAVVMFVVIAFTINNNSKLIPIY
jgi:hypothetical protein